eukprot:667945_1
MPPIPSSIDLDRRHERLDGYTARFEMDYWWMANGDPLAMSLWWMAANGGEWRSVRDEFVVDGANSDPLAMNLWWMAANEDLWCQKWMSLMRIKLSLGLVWFGLV